MDSREFSKLPLKYQLFYRFCMLIGILICAGLCAALGWGIAILMKSDKFSQTSYVWGAVLFGLAVIRYIAEPYLDSIKKTIIQKHQKDSIERAGEKGEATTAHYLGFLPPSYIPLRNIKISDDNNTVEIDHIVIGPSGIILIETKNYSGTINISPSGWIREWDNGFREGVKSPVLQVERHKSVFLRFLERNGIVNVPVYTAVAIANEKAIIIGQDKIPVLKSEVLQSWIESLPNAIDNAMVDRIYSLILPYVLPTSPRSKVEASAGLGYKKLILGGVIACLVLVTGYASFRSNESLSMPLNQPVKQPNQQSQQLPPQQHIDLSPPNQSPKQFNQQSEQPSSQSPSSSLPKTVRKYYDKVSITINSVQKQSNAIILNITIENKADKEVSFAVFKTMFLVDPTNQAYEAEPHESSRKFFTIPARSTVSGPVKFPYSGNISGTFSYRAKMFIMDPSYLDRDVEISFIL